MHALFLRRALELADRRRGFCAPNPAVGAVLVRDGRILSEGFHWAAGQNHAEVEALKDATPEDCLGATLYISLEPCCHHGRTPACTDLILKKGLSDVVYAFADPNPMVSGKGHSILASAGVSVTHFRLAEVDAFYQSYAFWTRHHLPFTTIKLAMSLDGKTAGPGGVPLSITGPEANRFTHERRLKSDGILTSAKTVLADDPRLNARLYGAETPKPLVILDRLGRTPPAARIFQSAQSITLYTGRDVPEEKIQALQEVGAQVIALEAPEGVLPLKQILSHLGERGFHDLWVEGGAALFSAFLNERLAQKAYIYVAPLTVGTGTSAFDRPWEDALGGARVSWMPQGRDVVAEMVW